MFRLFFKKRRTLGRSAGKRQYDLPLQEDAGTRYLILLIGLMTFLTAMALAAAFALSAMSTRWTTGLENKMTIEVPAKSPDGTLASRDDMKNTMTDIARTLAEHPAVGDIDILSDEEIVALVEPWLGEDVLSRDIPVPGLASITVSSAGKPTIEAIRKIIKEAAPQARLDTHKSWMNDLLRFTGTLQFLAGLIVVVIGLTMLAAIAGGIRSRMAVHREEVKLLHLMGAPDSYISRQFQKHAVIMSLKGALAGMAAAGLALLLFGWLTGKMDMTLLPGFELTGIQKGILVLLPVLIAALAGITARKTVETVLNALP